jgi:hypothetical protein
MSGEFAVKESGQVRMLLQRPLLQAVAIVAAAVAVFWVTLQTDFIGWDDPFYVSASERTQAEGLKGFLNLWSMRDIWAQAFVEFFPLRDTVYWLIWQVYGRDPVPFHVVNVAVHAIAALLVWRLVLALKLSPGIAFWTGLLFAVHPIHVESVAWISALKDPLFLSFSLASLLFYQRYRERLRPLDYALALLMLIGGLLCKSIALFVPVVMLAMERLMGDKSSWRLALTRVFAPGLIAFIFLIQFVMVGKAVAVMIVGPHGGNWGYHFILTGWALFRYVQQALVPATFSLHYCFATPTSMLDWRILGALLAVLVLAGVGLHARKRAPPVALMVIWFVASLAPVANVIPFPVIMNDRYLYAPSVAACLFMVWMLYRVPERLRYLLLTATVVLLGGVTVVRGLFWQEPANLWAEVLENPECAEDSNPLTVTAYFSYAATQRRALERALAMEAAFRHPKFRELPAEKRCTYYNHGALMAETLNRREIAKELARLSAKECPWFTESWVTVLQLEGRDDLKVALDAARRVHRLSNEPITAWQYGVARLLSGDDGGLEDLETAVKNDNYRMCHRILPFLPRAKTEHKERLQALYDLRCKGFNYKGKRAGVL